MLDKHNATRDGDEIWIPEIPPHIAKAVKDIEVWTKTNGWKNWQLWGIEVRGYQPEQPKSPTFPNYFDHNLVTKKACNYPSQRINTARIERQRRF